MSKDQPFASANPTERTVNTLETDPQSATVLALLAISESIKQLAKATDAIASVMEDRMSRG